MILLKAEPDPNATLTIGPWQLGQKNYVLKASPASLITAPHAVSVQECVIRRNNGWIEGRSGRDSIEAFGNNIPCGSLWRRSAGGVLRRAAAVRVHLHTAETGTLAYVDFGT